MRYTIWYIIIGYSLGIIFHQFEPQTAEFIFYKGLPFAYLLENTYHLFESYLDIKSYFATSPAFTVDHILLQMVYADIYAELLPTLGCDFLSQFGENELLSFYLQCLDYNIEISLEKILTNASHLSQSQYSKCILPFLPILPFQHLNRKQVFCSSIKIKNRIENFVYIEKVRSDFLNFYLKFVKSLPPLKLRHLKNKIIYHVRFLGL